MPTLTRADIHSDFSTDSGVWVAYRATLTGLYASGVHANLDDHAAREFNRKVDTLNLPTGLLLTPHDAGFRYVGTGLF
jgi:hypothetical protein